MMKRTIACLLVGSMALTACTSQTSQPSNSTQTVAEAALFSTLAGAAIGGLVGGGRGAGIGAGIGLLGGLAAGGYVAHEKLKYANVEARIAGESQIAAQATATAMAQTRASASQLAAVDAQLNGLTAQRVETARAQQETTMMLASLENNRSTLEKQKKDLKTLVKNQQDFIAATEQEVNRQDPQKAAQLAQWQSEIPGMQRAVVAMSTQIDDIDAMQVRVQRVKSTCC